MSGQVMQISQSAYAAILKITKPSVWLLHGYYPGGRNDPDNKKPA